MYYISFANNFAKNLPFLNANVQNSSKVLISHKVYRWRKMVVVKWRSFKCLARFVKKLFVCLLFLNSRNIRYLFTLLHFVKYSPTATAPLQIEVT